MSTLWHFPPCSFFLNWLSHFSPLYYSKLFRSDPVYKDLVIVYSSAASDFSFLCRDGSGNNLTQTLVWNLNPTRTWPHPSPTQPNFNPNLIRSRPKPVPRNDNRSDLPLFSKFKCSRAFQVGNLPQKKYPQTVIKLDRMSETRQKCQVDRGG